jgi:preprotein translocase subunit SecA
MRRILQAWSVKEFAIGPYPERQDHHATWLDRALGVWIGRMALWASAIRRRQLRCFATEVDSAGDALQDLPEASLRDRIESLKSRLAREGLTHPLSVESFALVREVGLRTMGLRHFPVQIMGGYALLRGTLAEMATGEGKTLTAVLPAVTVALARIPVHIVTVNDYLAKRDAQTLAPIYEYFGLSVGWIEAEQETDERRVMYNRDVTYCVNKDLVFDYLRDRMTPTPNASVRHSAVRRFIDARLSRSTQLLRGLFFAIVDEADSIFVDEARTPLIISSEEPDKHAQDRFALALDMARALAPEAFTLSAAERSARLTPVGKQSVQEAAEDHGGVWRFRKAREQLIEQALAALHLYERDKHYMIAEEKIQIVDEFTGRTMADRSWEHGLHQLIETKEGLEVTNPRDTISRITYQRFFRRYLRLAGMTGTGAEIAPELRAVYGLNTIRIPTNRPTVRRNLGERVFVHAPARWEAVVARVVEMKALGRAVLVGTRSVEASESLGAMLTRAGIEHALLNARQDADEAGIVALAGLPGHVTVATNMAGRGTDIILHPEVRAAGGLHVILTEFHESRRIDRQLFGRAGRQGDPGSFESLVSLDDDLFKNHAEFLADRLRNHVWPGGVLPGTFGGFMRILAQWSAERMHARIRKRTLESEKHIDRSLAFSGRGE